MTFSIIGADNTSVTATTTYNFIAASHRSSWNTTEANRDCPVAGAFTITAITARFSTAPGSGQTRTLTVMQNGSPTSAAVTVSDTNVQNTATGLSVSFAAGDTISIRYSASAGAAATTDQYWAITADSVGGDFQVIFGGSGTTTNSTAYQQLQSGTGSWLSSAADAEQVMPVSGNFTAFYTASSVAPGSGDAWDMALYVNGSASALAVNYGEADTGIKSDTGTVAITAGDRVNFGTVETGLAAATAIAWSAKFEPTTAGQCFLMFGTSDPPSTSASEYEQLIGGGNGTWITTEANRTGILPGVTLTALYANIGTDPANGAGVQSWTFAVREELTTTTSATVTVSEGSTTANATFSVSTTAGNRYNYICTPANTPAAMTGGALLGLRYEHPSVGGTVVKDMIYSGFIPFAR